MGRLNEFFVFVIRFAFTTFMFKTLIRRGILHHTLWRVSAFDREPDETNLDDLVGCRDMDAGWQHSGFKC